MIWVKSPGLFPLHGSLIILGRTLSIKCAWDFGHKKKQTEGNPGDTVFLAQFCYYPLKLSVWYLNFWRKVKKCRESYEILHSQTSVNNFFFIRVCNDIYPPPIGWEFQILHFPPQLCSQGAGPGSHLMVHNTTDAICLKSNIGQAPEHALLSLHFLYWWTVLCSPHHPTQRLGVLLGALLSLSPCTHLIIKSCRTTSNPLRGKALYKLFIPTYIKKGPTSSVAGLPLKLPQHAPPQHAPP